MKCNSPPQRSTMKDFFEVTCETDNEQEALIATAKHLKEKSCNGL